MTKAKQKEVRCGLCNQPNDLQQLTCNHIACAPCLEIQEMYSTKIACFQCVHIKWKDAKCGQN
jgi:hypothetical protein